MSAVPVVTSASCLVAIRASGRKRSRQSIVSTAATWPIERRGDYRASFCTAVGARARAGTEFASPPLSSYARVRSEAVAPQRRARAAVVCGLGLAILGVAYRARGVRGPRLRPLRHCQGQLGSG